VHIKLTGAPEPLSAYVERIDDSHANAKSVWREMGEPEYLSLNEMERLQDASRTEKELSPWKYEDQAIDIEITMPPHAVAVITLEFANDESAGGVEA
jgi:xylan 1,4-beta-xylosidase